MAIQIITIFASSRSSQRAHFNEPLSTGSYYDQLVSLEGKVPPQEVQIPFKWKDAFDRGSIFGGRMSLSAYLFNFYST
ncbi:hypothetical protein MSG28_008359 [Choristoneura fumiferana]|uniref:Uncharacterized protein n=1 Tax=Choristoneura fumiferana TaxID=7141 RepID=A0ACC0JB69_CHOFU|nr:hypothetical protein MSG28_008359 [Choristoneura fumiferana]